MTDSTDPSIGAFTVAQFSAFCACASDARLIDERFSAAESSDCARCLLDSALVSSASLTTPAASSLRSRASSSARYFTFARAPITVASAARSWARCCSACAWYSEVSICAITWPFVTFEPMTTLRSSSVPVMFDDTLTL